MNNKNVYIIGIGGVSMSAIAKLLIHYGYNVSGSDNQMTDYSSNLKVNITIGANPDNIDNTDIVIYTSSIPSDHPELVRAKELNKIIYSRPQFMGLLSSYYKNVICIAGTHGKSTTTGMTSLAFIENGVDPTILIGANLPLIDGNIRIGSRDYLILETCEFKDAFLSFKPTSETILNIDDDHLDYFINIDNIKKSFTKFMNIETNKNLVLNADDSNMSDLIKPNLNTITYGINNSANLMAKNVSYDDYGHPRFDVYYNDELLININLSVIGIHNIYNALATIAQTIIFDLDINKTKTGIELFTGVGRRFEHLGTYKDNIEVYDDYAHHPTEIMSTLNSVKSVKHNKSYAIFQPHTYSRTKEHLSEFAAVLSKFDNIIIAPIYAAREINTYNVHESDLVNLIKENNNNVIYLESYDLIVDYLKDNLNSNDLVITIGAGPVNNVGLKLLKKEN